MNPLVAALFDNRKNINTLRASIYTSSRPGATPLGRGARSFPG